jgi:hypothetical protein
MIGLNGGGDNSVFQTPAAAWADGGAGSMIRGMQHNGFTESTSTLTQVMQEWAGADTRPLISST